MLFRNNPGANVTVAAPDAEEKLESLRGRNLRPLSTPATQDRELQETRQPGLQTARRSRRVLDELCKLDPQLQKPRCSGCGRDARLEIGDEGIVRVCSKCKEPRRVDTDTLQRLADHLRATCFSCNSSQLKSTAKSYGNILMCQNHDCGVKNTWRGVSDRL